MADRIVIEGPVTWHEDGLIIDKKGNTLMVMTWKGDLDHQRRQELLGRWIINMINQALLNPDSMTVPDKPGWRDLIANSPKVKMSKELTNGQKEKV